jgi:RNA polymerase sigma factor (sigma-70 family)
MNPKLTISPFHKEGEEVIWNALRGNSREAFAVIYYRFFKILLQRGLQITDDRELVKDCIHDLFLEIWISKSNLATPISIRAYLIVSLKRKIFRRMKKMRVMENDLDKSPIELVDSKEDQIIAEQHMHEQQCRVSRAVNSLTGRQKEAIQLKFFLNLSYEEIAARMRISTDSIYNLISKALFNLQKVLVRQM